MNIESLKEALWDEKKRLEERRDRVRFEKLTNISSTELSSLGGSLMTVEKILGWLQR